MEVHEAALASCGCYSVVFLDLDRFGKLNNHLGDSEGDRTLRRVAEALTSVMREGEKVYRKGGEELVVILDDADASGAARAAERYRSAIEEAALPHGGFRSTPIVTASVGVAQGPGVDQSARDILTHAGLCMLTAKRRGRNRVSAHPMRVAAARP